MKNKIIIIFTGLIFITIALFFNNQDKMYKVKDVISPIQILFDKFEIKLEDFDCFDSSFTDKNKKLSENLNITEDEAFILGNLGKYYALGELKGRFVYIKDFSDLIYLKTSYKEQFKYSGFCLQNGQPCYKEGLEKRLREIRHTQYVILDLDNDTSYKISSAEAKNLKRYLVIKKAQLPKHSIKKTSGKNIIKNTKTPTLKATKGKIKIFFTDFTDKNRPDRNCNCSICQEILSNINNSKDSIDMAIYGYSRIPEIENALISAQKRGVKVRIVYDSDVLGKNIYPDTDLIVKLFPENKSDINSDEAKNIMHNKFYIFDKKVLITGSANLSHTDMSGFNSNSMVVIESSPIAQIYEKEFEEMYSGKFHNNKTSKTKPDIDISGTNVGICFSPQDKCIEKRVVPLINQAKEYIYIPTFVLTDRNVTSALISAKKRGVDVKIIIDALNASVQHSKHKELRLGGVLVKTENYAGKMHSKSMIIDDDYTILGSMNFSYSGENKNDENMLVIKNSEFAKTYREFFLYQWNKIDDKWLKYNARAEGKDSIGSCSDGLDNNYDGLTDAEDPACK